MKKINQIPTAPIEPNINYFFDNIYRDMVLFF